jgi:hypothetical protein
VDLRAGIARFAATGPVPVFAVAGSGMRAAVQDLRLSHDLELVGSPRAAAILLIAGEIAEAHREALARTHDLLPHPRATVAWGTPDPLSGFGSVATSIDLEIDPVPALRQLFRDLLTQGRPSEPPLLPDVDPVDWRGVGPYGQGGTGMTGGSPYGRSMAELGPDRDGLRLDVLPVMLGPFFPHLPAGLVLDLKVAGDVVIEAATVEATGGRPPTASQAPVPAPSPFVRALSEPVPVVELELARARDHLRWLADALIAQGLLALGLRALRLAQRVRPGEGDRIRALAGRLRPTGLFRWSLPRGAHIDPTRLAGLGLGPIARAAGLAEDVRAEDPGYRALGFVPFLIDRSDPAGRWQVRLEDAARALDVAARAGERRTTLVGRVESPRGRLEPGDSPTDRALELVPEILSGLGWGDAIATLISLDLDLDEAGAAAAVDAMRATA